MKAVGDAVDRDTGGVDNDISGDAGVDAVGDVDDDGDGDSGVVGGCVNGQVDKDDEAKKIGLWNQTDPDLYPSCSVTHKLFNL